VPETKSLKCAIDLASECIHIFKWIPLRHRFTSCFFLSRPFELKLVTVNGLSRRLLKEPLAGFLR
jgi:hypothetical protein